MNRKDTAQLLRVRLTSLKILANNCAIKKLAEDIEDLMESLIKQHNGKMTVPEFIGEPAHTFEQWKAEFEKPIDKGILEDQVRNAGIRG